MMAAPEIAQTECPSRDRLRALTLGSLSDEDSDDLVEHVKHCGHCQSDLETLDDGEDSLIADLRFTDDAENGVDVDSEPQQKVALAKALGALAISSDDSWPVDEAPIPIAIGEYKIVRSLGRGGMGKVYLAQHTKLGRQVALKVVADHRLADARVKQRFEKEMRAIGRLSHPNIVIAHDAREIDGTAVLVTEYIDGLDLGQIVNRLGPLNVSETCEIIRQTAVALQYTSDQGFVHRDIKPSNIMLTRDGDIKLLDLGLARLQEDDNERPEMTGTGQTMVTADYISPEQVTDSRSVDIRSDLYSLGCTLMKLLTGRAPFASESYLTAFAKMNAHVSDDPPQLSDCVDDSPRQLGLLVQSLLAKSPEDRPRQPIMVAERLSAFTDGADLSDLIVRAIETPEMSAPECPVPLAATTTSPSAVLPWWKKSETKHVIPPRCPFRPKATAY